MLSTYCISKSCITGIPDDTRTRYALLILQKKDRHPVVSISGIACVRSPTTTTTTIERLAPPQRHGVMVPETSPAIDTIIDKLAVYLPLRRVSIPLAMQSALNRINGMNQRSRELRQNPDSLQQVPIVANLQYTCSTSRTLPLHLAFNKYIENTGTVQNLLNFPCLTLCYPFRNHSDTAQMEHTHRSMSSVHRMEMAASVLYEMTAFGYSL
ncbi:hypothetical protein BASA60_002535 [Batrachochytrium salamandrivorans]|nr:hypothetical protein BASA60_002535 [Batrachochytrium salamandrivorans]